ncbi:hypothetical protein PsalN5692_00447 [Piscirickettsia salmonis]|uniref:hypothetical protein n=1 Tax=Piscirickettsia salmonis TaxID=1238 RepID=UPI0012B6C5A1|nr:hypothetical protein [Piscirickettsia salmonis]QGP49030.1 hypothetical protein PsalN5692_00447 [Piscirickettsia salmonis]
MPIIYPGIQVSLNTSESLVCKHRSSSSDDEESRSLSSLAGQSYFLGEGDTEAARAVKSNVRDKAPPCAQGSVINSLFIKEQAAFFTGNAWDSRNSFSYAEYSALTELEQLRLNRLHAVRWNYGRLLSEAECKEVNKGSAGDEELRGSLGAERTFLQQPEENESAGQICTIKLYAGWFIWYVNNRHGTNEAIAMMFLLEKVASLIKEAEDLFEKKPALGLLQPDLAVISSKLSELLKVEVKINSISDLQGLNQEIQDKKIPLTAEHLFKKEMKLDAHCDLLKEVNIAIKIGEFRRKLDVLKALPINQSDRRKVAISRYEAAAVTSFVNYQSGYMDQGSFITELQAAENQCTKVLDDSCSRKLLKVAVNALTLCLTLGIANLIHKADTGEFLFFNQSAETKQLKEASQALKHGTA